MKGYIIDDKYIVRVKQLMKQYPKPRKRLTDTDGTILPIITEEVALWS